MQVRPGIDLSKRVGLVVRPGDVDVQYPFAPGESMPDTGYGVAFAFKPPTPMLLVGAAGASRVEVRKASATFDLDHKEGELEAVAGVSADDVVAVLSGNDFDGFLGGLLGGRDVTIPLKLAVTWSSRTGFRINGGAGFEVGVDPHLAIGPVRADEVRLALRATADTAAAPDLVVETTVAVSAALGPFAFSLSGIGVRLRLAFTAGNAGPFDIDAGFVPPNGVGIKIDSGTVVGGGFLLYDPAHARYAGILQLEVAGLAITAIGLLTTRLPDGTKGYSLLISISADIPPVALGFGFTLEGVGGLIAVNRTIDVDALGRGIKSGAADSVLFPPDPIRDANRIITDLEAIFPPARDRFVFGPMALIAWGSPCGSSPPRSASSSSCPCRSGSSCSVSSRPCSPTRISRSSSCTSTCSACSTSPRASSPSTRRCTTRASPTFPLTGDMALRARWLGDRVLALALGGLHPRFPAPAGFPTLRRLQVELGNGDNPRLTLDAYLAVTSNTVQVGAAFELSAKAAGFNVLGHLGFDALFVLSPFSFEVDVSARVSLRRGSAHAVLDLARLHAVRAAAVAGEGQRLVQDPLLLHLVPLRHLVGRSTSPVELPSVDPWPLLREALADARSWAGFLPGEIDTAVSLRADTPPAGVVRVHPAGGLEVRQKVVPLAHKLTQFGGAPPVGPDEYRITRVSLNGSAIDDRADAIDWFAPAQYEALNDADKLSRPSFEQMPAGVRVGGAPVDADAPLVAELKYETVLIDVDFPPWTRPPEPLPLFFVNTMIHSSAAATASIATRGNRRFVDRSQVPALAFGEERYTVMAVDDLTARTRRRERRAAHRDASPPAPGRVPRGASRGPRPTRGRARVGGARMTDEVAVHSFLSHLRTGVGAAPFPPGPVPIRRTLAVEIEVNSEAARTAATTVELYGPADVVGLDADEVVRTDPAPGAADVEPNYFPAVEFDAPDLPWRYSPVPAANGRLLPWLTLVVLTDEEATLAEQAPGRLPVVVVADPAKSLPPSQQRWAWAHVQVADRVAAGADVVATLAADPARVVSRLLCPRRLRPLTTYRAYVVPAFEAGRLAGLGRDPGTDGAAPAWTAASAAGSSSPCTSRGRSAPAAVATSSRSSAGCRRASSTRVSAPDRCTWVRSRTRYPRSGRRFRSTARSATCRRRLPRCPTSRRSAPASARCSTRPPTSPTGTRPTPASSPRRSTGCGTPPSSGCGTPTRPGSRR